MKDTTKAKAATKEAPAKEAPAKAAPKAAKSKAAPKAASAFSAPLKPSKELAAVIGSEPVARTEVVKKVWEYIKTHKLQNEANKREIMADDKLKPIFGKDKVTMFEMNKHLNAHLSK